MKKRTPLIAANWKMNKSIEEARIFISQILPAFENITGVDVVLCPPFISLLPVSALLAGTDIMLGAQNMHWEQKGAFTGEISPNMVAELCRFVILGHSERRAYFGETDETVNKKLIAAQQAKLIPIVCVGETLREYESNLTAEVVSRQIYAGLVGIDLEFASQIVIAYEPVWAIGTGRASTADNAEEVIGKHIRKTLEGLFGEPISSSIRILYGGSVTSENAADFFSQPDIDGALVGGASLKAEEFPAIIRASIP